MRPPRPLEGWLRRRIPPSGASGPSILGDLSEEYARLHRRRGVVAATVWYAVQAVGIGGGYAIRAGGAAVARSARGAVLDLRASRRALGRTPGTVAVAVVTLALGVGLTSAAVSVVDAIWFAPLPWPEADRIVDLEDHHPVEVCDGCSPGTSLRAWREWRELPVFEAAAVFDEREGRLGGDDGRRLRVSAVAGDGFEILGFRLARGRGLGPDDEAPGAPPVMVLAHDLWTAAYGGDPGVVGREVELDGVTRTVVGILDPSARPVGRARAWIPLERDRPADDYRERGFWAVARLAPGVDVATADAALGALASARFGSDPDLEPGWSARATPLRAVLVRSAAEPAAAAGLVATAALVLLITILDLASLLVARVAERERELGLRTALGASRWAVARAAALEAGLLAAAGGLLGVLVAVVAGEVGTARFGSELPGWVSFDPGLRRLLLAVGVVTAGAAACSVLPLLRALELVRPTRRRRGGRLGASAGPDRLRVHDLLLGAQVILGMVLVAGSVSAVGTFLRVRDFDTLGHRWEGITSVRVEGAAGEEGTGPATDPGAADRLVAAFTSHPAVASASAARGLFLGSWGGHEAPSPVQAAGAAEPVPNATVPRHALAVGPGWFDLFEIPIVAGRPVGPQDRPGAPPAAVLSTQAARVMWPDREPAQVVGEGFTVSAGDVRHPFTVVGIARDVVLNPGSAERRVTPRIYTALAQTPPAVFALGGGAGLMVHLELRPGAPGPSAWHDVVAAAAPDLAVAEVTSVEATLRQWILPLRITGWALGSLAALALGLLGLGVFGTVSYRMAITRREIGIRRALGAPPASVVRAVVGRLARVLAVSCVAGLAASVVAGRALAGGVPLGARDGVGLGVMVLLLGAVAGAAALPPLRRALRLQPVDVLAGD